MDSETAIVVLQQVHEHARNELQLYVGWFTFFLTLLLGSMGWSLRASLDRRGRVVAPFPFYCIVVLFSVQLVLSVLGTTAVANDLRTADAVSHTLQKQLLSAGAETVSPSVEAFAASIDPFPQGMHRAMELMRMTLVTNLVFWLVVALVVATRRGRKLVGSAD